MVNQFYKIKFTGLKEGVKTTDFSQIIAGVLGSTPEAIAGLIASVPLIVKDGIDSHTAEKYREIIEQAGGLCTIEPSDSHGINKKTQNDENILKTCPNCGYKAVSADDPLLTAYQGRGECPICGAIPGKKVRDESSGKSDAPSAKHSNKAVQSKKSGANLPKPMVALLGLAFFILIIHFLVKNPDDNALKNLESKTISSNQKKEQGALIKSEISQNVILPGESKSAKISMYLPYFHKSSYFSINIEPDFRITNTWEDRGVTLEINNFQVRTETVSLPEKENKRGTSSFWIPDLPYGKSYSYGSRLQTFEEDKELYFCHEPVNLAKIPESQLESASKDINRQINQYTLYIVDLDMNISVPDTVEFRQTSESKSNEGNSPRNPGQGSFCIDVFCHMDIDSNLESMLGGTSFEAQGYTPTRFTPLQSQKACLMLGVKDKRDGMFIYQRDRNVDANVYCEFQLN